MKKPISDSSQRVVCIDVCVAVASRTEVGEEGHRPRPSPAPTGHSSTHDSNKHARMPHRHTATTAAESLSKRKSIARAKKQKKTLVGIQYNMTTNQKGEGLAL